MKFSSSIRWVLVGIAIIAVFAGAYWWAKQDNALLVPRVVEHDTDVLGQRNDPVDIAAIPEREVLVEGLEIPWSIAFLPEGGALITGRPRHPPFY